MPAPAIAAALTRLLPLIEGLGARGGAAATLGGGAAEGGIGSMVGRLFSGTKAFGSEAELGGALRKISDLSAMIETAQEAMGQKAKQREQISQKARNDERQFAFSDPAHTDQLASLAREQHAQEESMRQSQRQMSELRQRAEVTTNPAAARAESMQRATTILGAGYAASQFGPPLLRNIAGNLPGVKGAGRVAEAAQNAGSFIAGPVNSNIAGQMAGAAKDVAGSAMSLNPTKLLVTLSKLPQLIENWGSALVESQRGISRFNGTLAMTFAEQERRGTIRGIESGQRTGGATSELSSTLQDLYDQIQPMRDVVTIVIAKGLTQAVGLVSVGIDVLKHMHEAMKELPLIKGAIENIEERVKKAIDESRRTGSVPIHKALEEAFARDKNKRIGIAKR